MLKNYFLTALRNFKKNKGYTFINIAGLAIGVACCLFIFLFVRSELSYDRFHEKAEHIYRVGFKFHVGANQFDTVLGPCPLAAALVQEFPEVQNAARVFARQSRGGDVFIRYQDKRFKETRFLWADSTIFQVLTIPLIQGNPAEALREPNSVVLTQSAAEKYFGKADPMGKMLELEDGSIYQVTGVTRGWTNPSHFYFDFLGSFSTLPKSRDTDYYDTAVSTYILLAGNASPERLKSKLPEFAGKCMAPIIEKIMAVPYKEFLEKGNFIGFMIQPLLDIHLHSDWGNELEPQGNINIVAIFSAIAVLILIVACINFINLTTARSSQRANEVGVRKVVGSTRKQLMTQFLTESIFLSSLSVILALILVELALPAFNQLTGKNISPSHLHSGFFLALIILAAMIIGMAAGSYPALMLASFKPAAVLKGKIHSGCKGRRLRSILVIFQFCASITLLIGTTVITQQLRYLRNKDLGFEKDHIIVVQRAEKLGKQQEAFKNRLRLDPNILGATFTDSLPQMLLEAKVFQKEGEGSQENNTLITITSDHDLLNTYGLKMISGRFFEKGRSTDSEAVVLNETAVKALGIKNPLADRLVLVGLKRKPMNIIGIIRDFHMESLYTKIGPTAVILRGERPGVLFSARIKSGDLQTTLKNLQALWKEFTDNQPFEYTFFDDQFGSLYESEIQAGKVISIFTGLAISIACLGLIGLASFTVIQRTKEIGIRKVLGASTKGILFLLNKDIIVQVAAANLIAWPLAYYAMSSWLQNFAYRIQLSIGTFAAAAGLALLIALLTASFQSFRAAHGNPADSLRYE